MGDGENFCRGCGQRYLRRHAENCAVGTSAYVKERDCISRVVELPPVRREERLFTLIQGEQLLDLLKRVRIRHPEYMPDALVKDLHREADRSVPIMVWGATSSLDTVGWVDGLVLTPQGTIEAHVEAADERVWDMLEAGAGLSGNIAFDWTIKSDGSTRPVFLTEVMLQPPVPVVPEQKPPTASGWHVHTFALANDAPAYGQQAELDQGRAIQDFLNRTPHTYTFKQAVVGTRGCVHVIGYSYDPENVF